MDRASDARAPRRPRPRPPASCCSWRAGETSPPRASGTPSAATSSSLHLLDRLRHTVVFGIRGHGSLLAKRWHRPRAPRPPPWSRSISGPANAPGRCLCRRSATRGCCWSASVAIVGTDDGQITAVDIASGRQTWSVDVGDHVLAALAGTDDLVLASVRPEAQGSASLVALHVGDGSEAWRFQPSGAVLDLGSPSVGGDLVYVVASDGSLRAVALDDGAERWAARLYTPTAGSPPAVNDAGVFVTDQSGTIYAFDPASGAERWRYASNRFAVGGPIVTADTLLQPASDGTILAVDTSTGHQVWHATVSDAAVIGLAATADMVVATSTGTTPGFVALETDPAGVTEDITESDHPEPDRPHAWLVRGRTPSRRGPGVARTRPGHAHGDAGSAACCSSVSAWASSG